MQRPDILVLAGGAVLGEAWMSGVLAGLEDEAGFDLRESRAFVGTSAGSIVAARLASGRSPRRPPEGVPTTPDGAVEPDDPQDPIAAIFGAAAAPLAPLALRVTEPAGALARIALLRALGEGTQPLTELHRRVAGWAPAFDGRLLVCTVDRASGRRVVFGAPGAPTAEVPDAVAASCAIPGRLAPTRINGRVYVDGGVWSVTNLDAAPARGGDQVLCLDPTANPQASRRSAMGLFRLGAGAITAVEIAAVRQRGASVSHIGPDARAGTLMAPSLLDPGPSAQVYAAGHAQGRALAVAA